MKTRPRLSFWQIWNMSFGFLGIQFGFALQNVNVSRVFETLGAQVEAIPILWIAAPVTGLIVQPIVGYMSDNTWTRLGRRRPFFLIGALIAATALVFFPMAPLLWIAVGIFWILGASIDMCMEPFRAFVGDMLPPEQRNRGFAMQSFFIGTGSIVASMLPWLLTNILNVSNVDPDGQVPPSVKFSFLIGGVVFFIAVLWTVIRTKEYTPEQLREFEELEKGADRVRDDHKAGELLPYQKFSKPSFLWIALELFLPFWFTGMILSAKTFTYLPLGSSFLASFNFLPDFLSREIKLIMALL
jgi:maltose/moltooligosaccharide transporter